MAPDLDLAFGPARETAARIAAGELSPVEVMANAVARIEAVQPRLNCFAHLWLDDARAEARRAADEVARVPAYDLGPLHGVPVAVKETTPVAGRPWTQGSLAMRDVIADRDAYVVTALRRAGAIIVGSTTSPEFAYAGVTDSRLHGATRNPWNVALNPGGSSGGSAAAVAAGCVYLAEGSDMGGSVRIPAAWCGIVGFKPSIGRIPMDGLPGLWDSISHHGPLARSVDDAQLFLEVCQGPSDADVLSLPRMPSLPSLTGPWGPMSGLAGMRFALSIDLGCYEVHPQVEAAVRAAADALRDAGAEIEEVDPGITVRDYVVWSRYWSVFMAAYFGHVVEGEGGGGAGADAGAGGADGVDGVGSAEDRAALLEPALVEMIERGKAIGAVEYKRLEIERTDLWRRMAAVLAGRDGLLCPTMAQPPVAAARADVPPPPPLPTEPGARLHSNGMTAVFNLVAPCPAISVPCGSFGEVTASGVPGSVPAGLPIGLQIVAPRWRDDLALSAARAVELVLPEATGRRPPL